MEKNLLIIEDDYDTLSLMKEIFEMNECTVHDASDVDEALALLDQGIKFDFILTDYNVPGLPAGENILALIKDKSSLPHENIYLISGDANTKEIARSQGVRSLTKPISLNDLTAIIQ